MNLQTNYLGMTLRTPIIVSANPFTENLDNLKRLEAAGASAVVIHSLFEEQIIAEAKALSESIDSTMHTSAEASSYFPEPDEYRLTSTAYLELIENAKKELKIPVIGSLNGVTAGGWSDYAKKMESAGADAIELNMYNIPVNPELSSGTIESIYVDVLKAVKSSVKIPVAMKLSPYFTNLPAFVNKLKTAGADGLVLFNRFYQPDIDLNALEIKPHISLSTSAHNTLPMTWIGILKGRVDIDFCATGGIHSGDDAAKMLLVGANVTAVCSVLLKNGIDYLKVIERELVERMTALEYDSVSEMQGVMSQIKTADPGAFERALYMKAISGYKL